MFQSLAIPTIRCLKGSRTRLEEVVVANVLKDVEEGEWAFFNRWLEVDMKP